MDLFLSKLANSAVQLILFSIIPFLWWFFSARKKGSFLEWIGLKKINIKGRERSFYVWFGGIIMVFVALSVMLLAMLSGVTTATSVFHGLGLVALPAALVYAFFNTALSEEILFRGFLLKRLSSKFGFAVGNGVQSVLFGLLHGVMFVSVVGVTKALIIIVFTSAIGWCMGYVNEKLAGGSIIPSWLIHALANTFSSLLALFSIF